MDIFLACVKKTSSFLSVRFCRTKTTPQVPACSLTLGGQHGRKIGRNFGPPGHPSLVRLWCHVVWLLRDIFFQVLKFLQNAFREYKFSSQKIEFCCTVVYLRQKSQISESNLIRFWSPTFGFSDEHLCTKAVIRIDSFWHASFPEVGPLLLGDLVGGSFSSDKIVPTKNWRFFWGIAI